MGIVEHLLRRTHFSNHTVSYVGYHIRNGLGKLHFMGDCDHGGVGVQNSYPYQLSGGQQRVAITRTLAMNPEVLCFDKPTSAPDPELTGEVLRVIREGIRNHCIFCGLMVCYRQINTFEREAL